MAELEETRFFKVKPEKENATRDIILKVYMALEEKGHNPVSQIAGYLLSGDPTYITSHQNARSLVRKVERDEILEELIRARGLSPLETVWCLFLPHPGSPWPILALSRFSKGADDCRGRAASIAITYAERISTDGGCPIDT